MKTLIRTNEVPPGMFRYVQRETGWRSQTYSLEELARQVAAHRRANNLPEGDPLAEIQDQLCDTLPPGHCTQNSPEHLAKASGRAGLSFNALIRGTSALVNFCRGHIVAKEVAEKRAAICITCHYNHTSEGCTSCNMGKIVETASKLAGARKLAVDGKLHACLLCGCSLRAKVWAEKEDLQKFLPADIRQEMPDWCWAK